MRRLLILLLATVISGTMILVTAQRNTRAAYQKEYDRAVRTLRMERSELEKELREVRQELNDVVLGKGSGVLIFTEMPEELYEKVLPDLAEYEVTGVLALSRDSFPGMRGCITVSQYRKMMAHGWSACVAWNDDIPWDVYMEEMQDLCDQCRIEMPEVLYAAPDDYHSFRDAEILEAGFTGVVHHGEMGELITREESEDLFRLGAVEWNRQDARDILNQVVEYGGIIGITVDFSGQYSCYEPNLFRNMLDHLKAQEETFYLTDFEGAKANLTMAETNDYLLARRAYLEDEISRYDAEIAAVYQLTPEDLESAEKKE